jgi:hypothetical protein
MSLWNATKDFRYCRILKIMLIPFSYKAVLRDAYLRHFSQFIQSPAKRFRFIGTADLKASQHIVSRSVYSAAKRLNYT